MGIPLYSQTYYMVLYTKYHHSNSPKKESTQKRLFLPGDTLYESNEIDTNIYEITVSKTDTIIKELMELDYKKHPAGLFSADFWIDGFSYIDWGGPIYTNIGACAIRRKYYNIK